MYLIQFRAAGCGVFPSTWQTFATTSILGGPSDKIDGPTFLFTCYQFHINSIFDTEKVLEFV